MHTLVERFGQQQVDQSVGQISIQPIVELLSQVEHLARAGFALHWLHPKSKRPIGNEWAAKPVASLELLRRTYKKGNNVGVRLGEWSTVGGLYLHIIDVDIRVAELAHEAWDKLHALIPELHQMDVPMVRSGSGGESRHIYILTDEPLAPKKFAHSETFQKVWDDKLGRDVKKWDWELHLLGTGAQAAIPPSIHPDTGKPYEWINEFDLNLVDLGLGPIIDTAMLREVIFARPEEATINPERQKPMGLTQTEITSYLDDLPKDEWFEDRDQWMRVGMALHHETGGSDWGFETWCRYSKLSEKFDLKDQKRVWRSFKNKAVAPFRFASIVAVAKDIRLDREFENLGEEFDDLGDESFDDLLGIGDSSDLMGFDDLLGDGPAKKKATKSQRQLIREQLEIDLGREAPKWVRKINKRHAVARVSGKTVVMDFLPDGRVVYGSVNELHNWFENDRMPKDDTTVPASKMWIQHKQRRQYPNGIIFAPNRQVQGAYNHWQGFSVEPNPKKSCKLFLKHLREVFCAGNEDHFWYMIGWLAHMIQRPEEKPGVAVVAKGRKGAGKDTVFEYVGGLFPHHYITVGNQEQMVGKFNAHQEKCLLLHMQEGFWAGDRKAEGPLKYLITSNEVMIEPKGLNAFPIKSVLRLFISSNERWVVPATEDERRYFVLNVSNHRMKDHAYFAALRHEMENGGREALLDYLMEHDISKFQVRDVPDSEALAEQKVEGLKNVERWWHDVLATGSITGAYGSEQGHRGLVSNFDWLRGSVRIEKGEFREAYARWLRTRRYDGEEVGNMQFTKRMKALVPSLEPTRLRTPERIREHFFILPPLQECRTAFEEAIGSAIDWTTDQ